MRYLLSLLLAFFSFTTLHGDNSNDTKSSPPKESPSKDFPSKKSEEKEDTKKEESNEENDEESEDLILKPDNEWKDRKATYYLTPKNANKGVKGLIFPYTLWYDHYAWHEAEPLNEHAERSFRLGDDDNAFAIIVTNKAQVALSELDDIVIKNAKESGFEHAKISSIEKRNVNSNDVIYMHWQAILQGIHVDFLSYLYSDPRGSVFIHTYTPSSEYKDNKRAMELFLNGFTTEPLPKKKKKKKHS